jgi:hypothetical protein
MMMIHRHMAMKRNTLVSGHPFESTAFVASLAGNGAQFLALAGAFAVHSTIEAIINDEDVATADLNALDTMSRLCEYVMHGHRDGASAGVPIEMETCANFTTWRGSLSHNWDLSTAG